MEAIRYWISAEGLGHCFFAAFPVCLLILFLSLQGRRLRFVVPCALMTLIIVNPIFYRRWDNMKLYAYWRILWVVPVLPVVSAVIPSLSEKLRHMWLKGILAMAGVCLIVFGGTFLYNRVEGTFAIPSPNAAKLPGDSVEVVDYLLSLDDHPRAVLQYPLGVYARQYTGDIDVMYGRDITGYILEADEDAKVVHYTLNNLYADLANVSTIMANDDYEYLVLNDEGREDALAENGFEFIDWVAGYGIYRANGKPSMIKQKNELGQVISVTTVDDEGKPIIGGDGYATVSYEYDGNGNVIRVAYSDVDGKAVADNNGKAGYERQYDWKNRIIAGRNIGVDGEPISTQAGYVEYRKEYLSKNTVRDSFYDGAGKPVSRIDKLYASKLTVNDADDSIIAESYYDTEGKPTCSELGCASLKRDYDGGRLVRESYFDTQGKPVLVPAGYAAISLEYDGMGNVSAETYFGVDGEPVNAVNGYARKEREYDDASHAVVERTLDEAGKPVVSASGYAEVHRAYDGNHLLSESYYDAEGRPQPQAAGHVAISQEWFGDDLISRTYLDAGGMPTMRSDGYSRVMWTRSEQGVRSVHFLDLNGGEVQLAGKNLADGISTGPDGWSEWMIPKPNSANCCFKTGTMNLGEKVEGDAYTCRVEVEFKGVSESDGQEIWFSTQGAQDGGWKAGSIWFRNVINLREVPQDGIYEFVSTAAITAQMENVSTFDIAFRCDYWKSGAFRVRNIKIEKGEQCGTWTPGL